jgi:hypothetical protein
MKTLAAALLLTLAACQSPDQKLSLARESLGSLARLCAQMERTHRAFFSFFSQDLYRRDSAYRAAYDAKQKEIAGCHERLAGQRQGYVRECTPLFDAYTCGVQADTIIERGDLLRG